jgi:hypothetical protein
MYYQLSGEWLALPWTISASGVSVEMTYSYGIESVSLIFVSSEQTLPREVIPEGRIKVTVTPPPQAASTMAHRDDYFSITP